MWSMNFEFKKGIHMDINNISIEAGEDIFYNKEFMDVLESHILYLRNSSNTRVLDIESKKTSVYLNDLFGYLNEIKIPAKYHWITMRLNNMYSTFEFKPGITKLLLVDSTDIEKIRSSHMSTGVMSI